MRSTAFPKFSSAGTPPILPIYLTGVAEAYSLRILALDEHGNVISSSNGLYFGAGPNPKGLIEVEPGELRELEILSRVYFTGTYYTTEDQSIEKRSREILEALEPSREHLSCMHQPERQGGRRQRL
ncbi:MAG: hypothetical protein WAO51_10955 [Bacillota bacterium]